MDQFAITNAIAGHALLLDTRTLLFEHLPMNQGALADTQIVVCNSMVKHSIAAGEYGKRRAESELGQAVVRERFPAVPDLGQTTLEQLQACEASMSPESFRRCRHIVSDNARVRQARAAMFAGDPVALGQLMLAGHASERDDFECSSDEIDFLVETAAALPGCFGARLTGGGFGGCTVNLVDRTHATAFAASLKSAYKTAFDIDAETYLCEAVDGAIALQATTPTD
jgi:galactokinase